MDPKFRMEQNPRLQSEIEAREIPPTAEGKETVVTKVHFLIHPGFGFREEFTKDPKRITDTEREQALFPTNELYERYIEVASKMGGSEIMFAFPMKAYKNFRKDIKSEKMYAELLRDLRSKLGRRLVVLTDNVGDVTEDQGYFLKAAKIAAQRGFIIGSNVASDAYGESLMQCVITAAATLNKGGNLGKSTRLVPELTDAGIMSRVQKDQLQLRLNEQEEEKRRSGKSFRTTFNQEEEAA